MTIRTTLLRLHWLLDAQLGLDPRKAFRSLRGFPRYVRDSVQFRKAYSGSLEWMPCLHDWGEEGGTTGSEYFWQDLIVARRIFTANPERHVDVGSRVDGFVAHVASFREIEVFDVRPVTAHIPGIIFRQADLTAPVPQMAGYCDSLSCLHALEHFGLGRYGDPVDPAGFEKGLVNMAGLLRPNGVFYLSVPIGRARVEFNAQRVFDPRAVVRLAGCHALRLADLTVIRQGGMVEALASPEAHLAELADGRYALGVFTFIRGADR